jgi:tetratricopeptide (TPR) repeat protein
VPVAEALARFEALRLTFGRAHMEESAIDSSAAYLLAIAGRADEARERLARALATNAELGDTPLLASLRCQLGVLIERYLGDPDEAERLGRDGIDALERMGETGYRSTGAAYLAELLALRGDLDGAEDMLRIGAESTSEDDMSSLAILARARARIALRRGRADEALRHARESVDVTETSDYIVEQAESRLALADALEFAGRLDEAAGEVEQAIERLRRKGATMLEERATAELERLRAGGAAD